jgi:uncharacterized RDD family membrane protein YckC
MEHRPTEIGVWVNACKSGDFALSSGTPNILSMENTHDLAEIQDQREHLLDDIEYTYTQARADRRFGDYIIDRVLFYVAWKYWLVKYAVQVILFLRVPVDNSLALWTVSYVMAASTLVLYLAAFESLTGGKTPGKYAMGTRAVNSDGSRITTTTAILRCLSRLTPFEAFSALGRNPPYPWHDRWTKTFVIVEKLSDLPPM